VEVGPLCVERAVVVAWLLIEPFAGANTHLWYTHPSLGIVTDCIFVAGAAFTIWARITLGRN
jgi:protein-S-isoprenylcysteine O-methyltransferase Ste14